MGKLGLGRPKLRLCLWPDGFQVWLSRAELGHAEAMLDVSCAFLDIRREVCVLEVSMLEVVL